MAISSSVISLVRSCDPLAVIFVRVIVVSWYLINGFAWYGQARKIPSSQMSGTFLEIYIYVSEHVQTRVDE